MWGAVEHADVVVVDAQGNIFVPEIGPIRVVGIRNGDLAARIRKAVATVFTQNVNVYTNLEGTSPVVVYVTGYVNAPGSFAGVSSDSLLYFLSRAGGVDPRQGSYREITVKRGGEVIEEIDLYDFLLEGTLARVQFMDGDTIVVRPRGNTVEVTGSVRNEYRFEIPDDGVTGRNVAGLARPRSRRFTCFRARLPGGWTPLGVPAVAGVPVGSLFGMATVSSSTLTSMNQ